MDPRFFYYLRQIKKKHPTKDLPATDLDSAFLADLWDRQCGLCAYTGLPMTPKPLGQRPENYFSAASLDRIDSNLGYIRGNVQFVLLPINNAKGVQSDEEMRKFISSLIGRTTRT